MSKTFKTYYLHFTTPLHIGDHRPDSYENSESFIRSDTLVAAIYATWAKMGHTDWIPASGDPPFVLSSAFPYWNKSVSEKIHFFPRLKITPKPQEEQEYNTALVKALKKIQWLDQSYFEKLLHLEASNSFGKDNEHLQGDFLTEQRLPKNGIISKEIMNRVTIPRQREGENNDAKPFYMERIRFIDGGLFFMVEGEQLDRIEAALNLLQYEGFGTDRNVGNGFFKLGTGSISIAVPEQSNYGTNLGLYCPESPEALKSQLDDNSRFELIKRGGWITTPSFQTLEKNSIYMFSEGSVFQERNSISGKGGINLSPNYPIDHPIFRCGKSIFLPVKLQS